MLSAVFLLITFSFSAAEGVRYVTANPSPHGDCPSHPCLTLGQYINESSKYFTTGSTFMFLPGNHSLYTSLNITALSYLSLRGTKSNPQPTVVCSDEITVENVTSLDIEELTFIVHFSKEREDPSVFTFIDSTEVAIANSTFRKESINSTGRAISSTHSNFRLSNSLIESNAGRDGGAILAMQDTFMSLTSITFARNQALDMEGRSTLIIVQLLSVAPTSITIQQ